ncbi:30S ribosomal protein S2 [Patescibacteria group bacterium]|nr:30S ribosomal protein S2 [Patescibacteria group bacterium]
MAKVKEKKKEFNIDLEEMAKSGVHLGHRTFRIHPKIEPYLLGVRNNIHIIDLEKTAEKLKEALKFIQEIKKEGKILLLIGTKIQFRDLVKSIAKECGLPYVSERWLGGTFTNFETILKRIEYFKDLERKKAEGELEKYTKKEKLKIDKELQDLRVKFEGIKKLTQLPDAILVLDMKKDELAIKEAKKKGVKIIGIAHTNIDPNLADYPIPANDDAIPSVKYILEKVREAILSAKLKTQSAKK